MKMKQTLKSTIGTSFHGVTVLATYNQIEDIFGKPNFDQSGDNKVTYEWNIDVDGEVCTIYDWKEYRKFDNDEKIEWHIGGYNKTSENKLKDYIEDKLQIG